MGSSSKGARTLQLGPGLGQMSIPSTPTPVMDSGSFYSNHLPEASGSGFSDDGLSAAPRNSRGRWSLAGEVWTCFSHLAGSRGVGGRAKEASVKPSELSFSSEAVGLTLVGSFPAM